MLLDELFPVLFRQLQKAQSVGNTEIPRHRGICQNAVRIPVFLRQSHEFLRGILAIIQILLAPVAESAVADLLFCLLQTLADLDPVLQEDPRRVLLDDLDLSDDHRQRPLLDDLIFCFYDIAHACAPS